MSAKWQESWSRAVEYWSRHWREWIGIAAVMTAWLWAICLAVPSLTPFVLMEFQPINSRTIAQTYQAHLTALSHAVPILIVMLVATAVVGGGLTLWLLRKLGRRPGLAAGVCSGASTAGAALLAMALVRVPLGGQYLNPAGMALRGLVILGLFVVVVPAGFWIGPLAVRRRGTPALLWRRIGREAWYLPWTWLLVVVLSELLSAAISWTIPIPSLGTLILSLFVVSSGILHQSVAYFYRVDAVNQSGFLQKTS